MKHLFFTCLLIITTAFPAVAAQRGQATMTWLGIASSPRDEAMGGVSSLGDASASCAFTNPAGLGRIERGSAYFAHTSWLADMSVIDLAIAYTVPDIGTFGIAVRSMDYGDFVFSKVALNSQGYSITPSDSTSSVVGTMVGISYGRKLTDKFSVGGQFKYVTDKLGVMDTYNSGTGVLSPMEEAKLSAILFDFGTSYHTGWNGVNLSMTIQNFGASQKASNGVEEFTPPLTFKIGLEADVLQFARMQNDMASVRVRLEGVDPRDDRENLNVGVEIESKPVEKVSLALRGGWARRDVGGMSLGFGLGVPEIMGGVGGTFDYSYSNYGDILGSVNRFGLSVNF